MSYRMLYPMSSYLILIKSEAEILRASVLCLIPVFQYRCETVVPQRMVDMERAIHERDFKSFARLTMQVYRTSLTTTSVSRGLLLSMPIMYGFLCSCKQRCPLCCVAVKGGSTVFHTGQ